MGRTGGVGKSYSVSPKDYKLLEEIGLGASATVYRAIYLPSDEVVAVKCLDLDRCNSNLDDIRREAQTMSLIDHPNVIRAYCSFVVDQNLWVVMPFMAEGSCLHLMKIAYPHGFEEPVIGSVLKETLKALEYLHRHGHIHRDVKAGNILLDTSGEVKLADFGVSACMFDNGDRKRSRNTFVGTPCWMAPEVLQPGSGYDFKADIWSFGITALELAHGHAPFSKYPPMKVLLMTIQNAPPGLDYDRDKKFSKSFKEMVAMCLVKDQRRRPTAEKLLKHSFFKHAKPPELSVKKIFADLPPLWNRVKALQIKDAAQLALKKMPSAEQEAISQSEYQRGVSAWNFDIEDLKAQASLVQDDDEIQEIKEEDESMKPLVSKKDASYSRFSVESSMRANGINWSEKSSGNNLLLAGCSSNKENFQESNSLESEYHGKIGLEKNGSAIELSPSISGKDYAQAKITSPAGKGVVLSHSMSEVGRIFKRYDNEHQPLDERPQRKVQRSASSSGPLMLPNRASANSLSAPIKSSAGFRDSFEDKSKPNLVRIIGRFSVTSENVDLVKDIPSCTISQRPSQPLGQAPKETYDTNVPGSILISQLQNLFQQISVQQDLTVNLLNSLQPADVADASQNGQLPKLPLSLQNNGNVESAVSERERLLLIRISELQVRKVTQTQPHPYSFLCGEVNLIAELKAEKLKEIQLQLQIDAISGQEKMGIGDCREGNS